MENGVTTTTESVYCGVVIINCVFGGLNILLATWLAANRQRADRHKTDQYATVMRRLDQMNDKLSDCPLVHMDQHDS